MVLGFVVGCGGETPAESAVGCAVDADCAQGYICECPTKDVPCVRECQYAPAAPKSKR